MDRQQQLTVVSFVERRGMQDKKGGASATEASASKFWRGTCPRSALSARMQADLTWPSLRTMARIAVVAGLLDKCSELLEAVNALLSVPAFVNVVSQLMHHANPVVRFVF